MVENERMFDDVALQSIIKDFKKKMRKEKIQRILARTTVLAVVLAVPTMYIVYRTKQAIDDCENF